MNALFLLHQRLYISLVISILLGVGLPGLANATTITATATGHLDFSEFQQQDVELDDDILWVSGNLSNKAFKKEGQELTIDTSDLQVDSNFTSLVASGSLKSAILTLTLTPQESQLPFDSAGNQNVSESQTKITEPQQLALRAKTKIEVELLEAYSPEDLVKILTAPDGHLPIPYHDPTGISSFQLQVTAERPDRMFPIIIAGSLILALVASFGYVKWRKRKQQEERLAMIGKMTSTVIHDVKNSFAAIQGCAEVIADEALDPHTRKDFAQLIVSEIERGVDMTQEVLEFSRGQSRPLHLKNTSVHAFMQDILSVITSDFANRDIVIHTDLQYTDEFNVDVERMKRVFMNIITNARESMPDGGFFTIISRLVNTDVQFEFVDTGCGMSPELQSRIFEPLVTEGKAKGTGWGMTIVKEILDKHHARIDVQSAVEQGTTIRIFLPQQIPLQNQATVS